MRTSVLIGAALLLASCSQPPAPLTEGDPARGAAAIFRHGCGSCHSVKGLSYAHGLVGPPLDNVRDRLYIAGMLQNNPVNLQHWIRDPKSVNQKTAMPNLGVTAEEAVDIAAYLYSK